MPATVQSGDTLWAIAARHLGDGNRWTEIHALNQDVIPDPNAIEVGQVLRLPGESAPASTTSWSDAAASTASDAWASVRSSWEAVRQSWSAGWQALDAQASGLYDAIVAAPETYRAKVEGFVAALTAAKQNLTWIRAHEAQLSASEKADAAALGQRYNDLAAGFLSDVDGGESLQLGAGPLLIVAGIGVGVAAIAWAVASYEHAANLRDQTALFREDLAARVTASEQGRTLQPATVAQSSSIPASSPSWSAPSLPSPASPSSSRVGLVLIAGLGLASAAVLLPLLLRRS
jgi:LysM repeat protein